MCSDDLIIESLHILQRLAKVSLHILRRLAKISLHKLRRISSAPDSIPGRGIVIIAFISENRVLFPVLLSSLPSSVFSGLRSFSGISCVALQKQASFLKRPGKTCYIQQAYAGCFRYSGLPFRSVPVYLPPGLSVF